MADQASFDPHAVAIRPAATVMIVADRPALEVLMIERNARMIFAGGMWVFPGGAVDPGEADDFEPHCDGLDDRAASAALGLESGGLAYWVAAVRENFEEAGLLLGRRRDGAPLVTRAFDDDRRRLHHREGSFLEIVERRGLVLDTSAVHYVAHFITPLGSPRRFSARFFVSSPPEGQDVVHDESETVGWEWMAPATALSRFERGEIVMMTPTVRMLRTLARFDSAADVLEAARADLPEQRVRVSYDEGRDRDTPGPGGYQIVLPGEPGYEDGDEERENGWVRLRPLG